MRIYQPAPAWSPPPPVKPSKNQWGEQSTAPLHEAVGRALSAWEHSESARIKLFQLLCESTTLAACRAYGALESVRSRSDALRYAAEEFFEDRDADDLNLCVKLLKSIDQGAKYRNQIAHGIAYQPHDFGYFLGPPSYATRRRSPARPNERWGLGGHYYYRVSDLDKMAERFGELLKDAMSFVMYANEKYQVINPSDLHP